jgi:hypothetical protein
MGMSRPAIPAELKRAVLVEAGHHCAIPTCRFPTTEIAHIVPWEKVKEHKFENLIALCPNCHARHHKGEIDRQSLFQYKRNLADGRFASQVDPTAAPPLDPEKQAWEELQSWDTASRDRFEYRRFDERVDDNPDRYHAGTWQVSYLMSGEIPARKMTEFRDILAQLALAHSGRPMWDFNFGDPGSRPQRIEGVYEQWLGRIKGLDGVGSPFWRASPDGKVFLIRGHHEDMQAVASDLGLPAGTALFIEQPIRCVGTALLHAQALALALGAADCKILARFEWSGLKGRRLMRHPRLGLPPVAPRVAHQDVVRSEIVVPCPDAVNCSGLVDLVVPAVEPMYEVFDYDMEDWLKAIIGQELDRLRLG